MHTFDLSGSWQLARDDGAPIPGHLPGSTYLDYMADGLPDPFWAMNETEAKALAHHDYTYARSFDLTADFLAAGHVALVAQGVDTLCAITLNGVALGSTDNINRTWRLDAKPLLRPGENTIALHFANPFPYMAQKHGAQPLPGQFGNKLGAEHLRKTPCHFGWDWGPNLPPAGVIGSISLEAYEARIDDLRIRQHHAEGRVELDIEASLSPASPQAVWQVTLTSPDGTRHTYPMIDGKTRFSVENPQLWWCNGLGGQPLYQLEVTAALDGQSLDAQHRQLGLRTIALDTAPDAHGAQFRFLVNGVPLFAKGANWIPADSFITRTTRSDYDFYMEAARRANMNMLRVWGGGMYECEAFYDACDRNGILVWQDFIFACGAYPLDDEAFSSNVHAEVVDNVRRIRHRASLALWCGNNESELMSMLWKKPIRDMNLPFYHDTLPEWVRALDDVTPYWPGSPSAGGLQYKLMSKKPGQIRGDSHLWQVWHGMLPIEGFRRLPTRFCSEYGVESMPSMHTIRSFTDKPDPQLFDPVMQHHQRSGGGNAKILYYLLAKYRNPAKLEDFVYLSQLVQSGAVRFATDQWRRNMGFTNGALFWQMNDCWPVASWAGIDYHKQLKAVQYHARHFNKPLCLSNDYFDNRAELHVTNEHPRGFEGTLQWTLATFDGGEISRGETPVAVGATASTRALVLPYAGILNGRKKEDVALTARLVQNGITLDEKHWLLVPDKRAGLPRVAPQVSCVADGEVATVTLRSPAYARYVYLEADGVTAPWSDNFFDIPAGQSVAVTVRLPQGMDAAQLQSRLRVKTLTDVSPANGLLKDKLLRLRMILRDKNYLTWFVFKFI